MNKLELSAIKCRSLLEYLIRKYPESLEKEVVDYLQQCSLFYKDNARQNKEKKLKSKNYLLKDLELF